MCYLTFTVHSGRYWSLFCLPCKKRQITDFQVFLSSCPNFYSPRYCKARLCFCKFHPVQSTPTAWTISERLLPWENCLTWMTSSLFWAHKSRVSSIAWKPCSIDCTWALSIQSQHTTRKMYCNVHQKAMCWRKISFDRFLHWRKWPKSLGSTDLQSKIPACKRKAVNSWFSNI